MKKGFWLVVLSAALTGCASIDNHWRVPGWPELKMVEYHVAAEEVLDRCQQFARLSVPEGCTLFYFHRSEAHIYVRRSTAMQQMLEAWKAGPPR
jgi:hypothetical protein